LKHGTPPLVPATVKASVPEVVIGVPLIDIRPPVKEAATLDTVPAQADCEAAVMSPLPLTVMETHCVVEPKLPTLALTVASVVAKLLDDHVTSPVPAPVCKAPRLNASVEPSVIVTGVAPAPVGLPSRVFAASVGSCASEA
jgi:hypothetical protein